MPTSTAIRVAWAAVAIAGAGPAQAIVVCPEGCGPPRPVPALVAEFASFTITNGGSAASGAFLTGLGAAPFVDPAFAVPTIGLNVGGQTVITVGPNTGTEVVLDARRQPVASVFASAARSDLGGPVGTLLPIVESVSRMSYRVTIQAADAAHAATLSARLGTPLANVQARYTLTSTGNSQAFAEITTGIEDASFMFIGRASCIDGRGDCGSGRFDLPVHFADNTGFTNGNPLEFHSVIALSAEALGGAFRLNAGTGRGSAFIDPVVSLAPELDPAFFRLVVADGLVSNLAEPSQPVPEPGTWALMLCGVAALGMRLRQRTAALAGPRT